MLKRAPERKGWLWYKCQNPHVSKDNGHLWRTWFLEWILKNEKRNDSVRKETNS